jgi:hypothetical protein
MGFTGYRNLVDKQLDEGQYLTSSFRKVSTQATQAGTWADLSMSPGNPPTNFYASEPMVSAVLDGNRGIYHGQAVSPATKHLAKSLHLCDNATVAPSVFILCDYLLYYPFIDMDEVGEQVLMNTVSLPRYESGEGVKVMLVAQGNYVGNQSFFITYTNQDGVSGRTSATVVSNVATFIGSLVNGSDTFGISGRTGPFIPLQGNDRGVRSIQSITFNGPNGGIGALVLVKPIAQTMLRELTAPVERDFFIDIPSMPRILDGAYLNYLILPSNTIAARAITGTLDLVWG